VSGPSAKSEQAERRAIIKGDQQSKLRPDEHEPTTLHAMSRLSNDLEGRASARDYVAGSDAATDYPAIPSGPWSSGYGRLPDELPLGWSVDAQEPCGEAFEVARSLEIAGSASAPVAIPGSIANSPPAIETADPAIPCDARVKRRRLR
jgi:hypothetical protein